MQSEIDKAIEISLMISKNGGSELPYNSTLLEKIKMLPENNGRGICNDHTQVFLAMSSIFGLIAREVHNKLHVFIESYDRSLKKWIFIDPQYAIMAKDGNGLYLSLLEMRELLP